MVPNSDDVADAVAALTRLVHRRAAEWVFEATDELAMNRALASAGLLRAAELLDEAVQLGRGNRSVGANVLVRAAFEFWLIGSYALFGGHDAVLGIEQSRIRYEKLVAERNDLPVEALAHIAQQSEVLEEAIATLLDGVKPSSLNLDQVAGRLDKAITEATGEPADVSAIYNMLYRTHSTYDAHPPKAMGQLVHESDDGSLGVRPLPPWTDPIVSAAIMALYVGILGRWIESQLDGDGHVWDAVVQTLVDIVHESDNSN